jgi:hypothetical protein
MEHARAVTKSHLVTIDVADGYVERITEVS